MPVTPRRAAVLGHPVAHSLSPVLHTAAYEALGLDGWQYSAIDTTSESLQDRVDDLDLTWAGLSLTMPLKQTVIPMLAEIDPVAIGTGAVNTVVVRPSSCGVTLAGYNTDVYGLVTALGEGLRGRDVGSAVVLGAGATAASAVAALAELGCATPRVLARSLGRTVELREAATRLGVAPTFEVLDTVTAVEPLEHADVVVSTLPAHAADGIAAAARDAGRSLPGVLLDVVYDPRPTALARAWEDLGGVVVGGERMLLHQAARQVNLMTGRLAPVAAMDAALAAALDR
ncbi:Shikimate dehydrogenase substrate binding domain protein [Xylanimonas cellulosilytica DSM 15894]|uniref:Shikimate dehydrogenase substrate binding domain protein n=1 Tax=Xylanimonas cellulosilytica (strain DSM 15894 / JCM 12276 / CECT 5975 / KCTC 9989 / LMG 20990 / NBRC 107835 / XIL07) TaxID=446471 RepID=D1BSM4_XYLCX|nr:shikimate dehydrogenase [Xylanimonas cellulosilytica]ACZ30716.1 Shikimate dehydrogenase substrate binding domain protein [Xylanimonas cellulosilytica DSM 15894]